MDAGVDGAGLSIMTPQGGREPLYATDEVATAIERLQLTLGQGPCIDSSASGSPVLVPGLAEPRDTVADRWPAFRAEVTQLGARAVFAFPIRYGAIDLGAVDFYRRTPGPLGAPELGAALTSVDDVGLAVLEAPDQFGELGTSAVVTMAVHQAAGMVMVQVDCSIEEAMVRLRSTAFAEGRTVDELATDVMNGRRRLSEEEE